MPAGYKIRYVSSSGRELDLSRHGVDANGTELPSWEFEAMSLNGRLIGFRRSLPEFEIPVAVYASSDEDGISARNDLYEIPAYDRMNDSPGRLYLNDWYIRGYVRASEINDFWNSRATAVYKLTFVATESLWSREREFTFIQAAEGGFDFPYDFMIDFAGSSSSDKIINDNYSPSILKIYFQGAIDNPSVTIGGNEYRVDVSVASDEYLEIDGVTKKIEVVSMNGVRRNVFDKRHGLQVPGSGSYIFEKVQPGELPVIFQNDSNVSVTVVEQRAEPRWL